MPPNQTLDPKLPLTAYWGLLCVRFDASDEVWIRLVQLLHLGFGTPVFALGLGVWVLFCLQRVYACDGV